MDLLKFHTQPFTFRIPQTTPYNSSHFRHHLKFAPLSSSSLVRLSLHRPTFKFSSFSRINAAIYNYEEVGEGEAHPIVSAEFEDLALNGVVYQKTLRLVECSMFAAVTGLLYFLSNSLSIENYFGCFFALPIVISSLRWGIAAGRKTMVATSMLLFVLSGPVKALIYLLTHGLTGLTMGSLWRLGANWRVSIFLCTIVRSMGAMGYVLTTSFLISENILALITINIHASLTLIFAATGMNIVPSMNVIYAIFGTLVLLNSGFFVFLLHLLYSVLLTRLGMRGSVSLPNWLEKAVNHS